MDSDESDVAKVKSAQLPDPRMDGKELPESSAAVQSDDRVADGTTNVSETFKTPSFVIPSKKKVQSNTLASGIFKSPGSSSKNSSKPTTDTEKIDADEGKGEVEKEKGTADKNNETRVKSDKQMTKTTTKSAGSPAEQLKQAQVALAYKEPAWSALCEEKYSFEIIKSGAIIGQTDLTTKAFHVVGRLPSCDVAMEHPSLSRHHAVIQYSGGTVDMYPQGWYLYDLDSTHGTWINKNKVPPHKYHRLHVDYVVKFGGSTRLFILQGPDSDRMEESELSVNEMKDQREKQKKELELLRQQELEEAERQAELARKREESKGCSWGFDEEVEQEDDEETPLPDLTTENENLYIDDPKKSLNGYFEREGLDLPEYEFSEAGFGKRKCSIELPIDTPTGEPMRAEVVVSGKKKEAVIACALEACRILDRHGLLRKSTHESRKKKQKNWEEDDFYDSDEDVYLDRTGTIEKKRVIRMAKTGKDVKIAETYHTLLDKHKKIVAEIEEVESKLEQAKAQAAAMENDDVDALDAYMSAIKSGMMDTKTKMKLKRQLLELKQEEQKVRKLVNVAKPATLPDLVPGVGKPTTQQSNLTSSVGKMKGSIQLKSMKKTVQLPKVVTTEENDFEVEEDEDDDQDNSNDNIQSKISTVDIPVRTETGKTALEGKTVKSSMEKKKEQSETISAVTKANGPLSLSAVLEHLQNDEDTMETDTTVKLGKEIRDPAISKRKSKEDNALHDKKKVKQVGPEYDANDPEYAGWIPPENQAGDGKTYLNDKYGY